MLYKESAIAVMVAVMLGAASIFGALATPALATHDPDAVKVAEKKITQADDDSVIVDSIELTVKKSFSRAIGAVTIEVNQDGHTLESATLVSTTLQTSYTTVEVDIPAVEVKGDFEILVEYEGSGSITVSDVDIVEGTTTVAGSGSTGGTSSGGTGSTSGSSDGPNSSTDNVIANKEFSLNSTDSLIVKTVKFDAKKSFSRALGTVTVALFEDGKMRNSKDVSSRSMQTSYMSFEVFFNEEMTKDFKVVFMYEGRGDIIIKNIDVPGATAVTGTGGSDSGSEGTGTAQLVVEALDQNGNKLAGLYVALLNEQNQLVEDGFTEVDATFNLDKPKTYMVEMGDWYNDDTQTSYEFEKWKDSTSDSTRRAVDPTKFGDDNKETFTALYTVTENARPPVDDGNDDETTSPPPDSPSGTITMYAYRIPSPHWGATFFGANANMYFVVYNSTGYIIEAGYADETGTTIDDLDDGQTYWIYPTDCHHCHGGTHDVRFNHWEDSSTERPRSVTPGHSVGAYYEYVPNTP